MLCFTGTTDPDSHGEIVIWNDVQLWTGLIQYLSIPLINHVTLEKFLNFIKF